MSRTELNVIGAILLCLGLLLGFAGYTECIHPQEMARLGFVETEGGRFIPYEPADARIAQVERNYVKLVQDTKKVVVKLQRQIDTLKKQKRDK